MIRSVPILGVLVAFAGANLSAQSPASSRRSDPAPGAIVPATVQDSNRIRLFNSVSVLGERFVGEPAGKMRILESWGGPAGDDCDCLLSRVTIAINYDGDDLRAYDVGQLLDPVLDGITTEQDRPVAYLSYGRKAARLHARIEVLAAGLRITAVHPPPRKFK